MPRRIVDETGIANFIEPEERKSYKPPLTGNVLAETTSRLYSDARPGTPLSLSGPEVRRTAPKKAKPKSRIGPPVPATQPAIQPETDFVDPPEEPPPEWTPFVGAPLQLPPEEPRPNLTPSQFSALGGAPEDFAGVQEKLQNLPPEAGQLVKPKPSGVDIDEISRDLDAEVWRDPKIWGGSAALGASLALGPSAATLGGLGTGANVLGRAGVGALGGLGGSLITGDSPKQGALTGALLGPGLEDATALGAGAVGRALGGLRGAPSLADDATRVLPRAPRPPEDTALLNFPVKDATQPGQLVHNAPLPRAPASIGGGQTQNIRPPVQAATPRGALTDPGGSVNFRNPAPKSTTGAVDPAKVALPEAQRSLVRPSPLEFPPAGTPVDQGFDVGNGARDLTDPQLFPTPTMTQTPATRASAELVAPRLSSSAVGQWANRGPKGGQPAPGPVASPRGGVLGSLDSAAGAVRRHPLAAKLLALAGVAGGLPAGVGLGSGGDNAAIASPPRDAQGPFAVQRPTPTAVASPEHIEPVDVEEVETLKPLIKTSGISQQDYAQALAEQDGFDWTVASPAIREKYLIEASQYFEAIPPAGPLRSQPGGLRGGLLQLGRGAESIDNLLKGR